MPDSWAQTPLGAVFWVNGFDPPMKWDGLAEQATTIGVLPPTTALSMSGAGNGPIVGAYYAYCRFVDGDGNYSNFSPISPEFIAQGKTGVVTGATNASPIVITSPSHGLNTGAMVKVTGVGGNTSANVTSTITVIDGNSFSLDNSHGTADYTGAGTWQAGIQTLTYSNVPIPIEAKVQRRQILRNTDGQTQTFYVDVDTQDLTSTSFSSTRSDEMLGVQEAQALFDTSGAILANRFTVPPSHKAVIAFHQDRLFMAVQIDCNHGSVQTVFGSTTVQGIGTSWVPSMAGRYLYVVGARQSYQIAAVDTVNQVLTLTTPYTDVTNNFAKYSIRPAPAESRLIYYSEAGLPEAWPATNALSLVADGDEITGLMPKGSFIYLLERQHIYRFTFQVDPARDGSVFLSSDRGCINNRCWVIVDATAYMLDMQGIHAFSGGEENQPISDPIQEIFRPGSAQPKRINWSAQKWFHAIHFPPQETIRWFVALSGCTLPRHALCYNYRQKRWWDEEFPVPIASACSGRVQGVQQVFLGGPARKVYGMWQGTLDGPDPSLGTTRGTATAWSPTSLTDNRATFPPKGLVDSPLVIVDGTGKGQTRKIHSVQGNTLSVTPPWLISPDTTTLYQIGGISYTYTSTWFRFVPSEDNLERKIELIFQTLEHPSILNMRIRFDFSDDPVVFQQTRISKDNNGVATQKGSTDIEFDLTKANGFSMQRLPGYKEINIDGPRYIQVELKGVTNQDPFSVYQINVHEIKQST
jgi:hypothetical protein